MKVVLHGGDVAGFAADISCLPSLDFCLVALANANSAHFQNSAIVAVNQEARDLGQIKHR